MMKLKAAISTTRNLRSTTSRCRIELAICLLVPSGAAIYNAAVDFTNFRIKALLSKVQMAYFSFFR